MSKGREGKLRGVITIEAAIVMPLVLITVMGILYFAKVLYIQDQVHSAMTRTAHEMATFSIIPDKTRLIDLQQSLYTEGTGTVEAMTGLTQDVIQSGISIKQNAVGMTSMSVDTLNMVKGIEPFGGDMTWDEVSEQGKRLASEIPEMIGGMQNDVNALMGALKGLMEEAKSGLPVLAASESLDIVNGMVFSRVTEWGFYKHLPVHQLEQWGVSTDNGYVDFSDSTYMLHSDSIELVAKYEIVTPLMGTLIDAVPIHQTVTVRGFTGAYDYDAAKKPFSRKSVVEDSTDIFYVSNREDTECYHVYECLRKDLYEGDYYVRMTVHRQTVCSYCEKHYVLSLAGLVYYTSNTSRLHYTKECPKVSSQDISPVTLQQALDMGKRSCGKIDCTGSLKEDGD